MSDVFDVLDGGLLTTVQDAGRPDWTHLGVPISGAADPWSRAVANHLLGNDPGAAVLELTLTGPTLVARTAVTIGLAGADLGGRIRGGRRLVPGHSYRLAAGDVIELPGTEVGGARGYLAVPGGVDVPAVLGSRSTCLAGGFGGVDGRALRTGDTIAAMDADPRPARPELVWPAPDDPGVTSGPATGAAVLRVIAGPDPGLESLLDRVWRVSSAANRVGIRLDGEPLPPGIGGETITHGVPWGAIQVPSDGRPIVLGADHQTTGGYRVVGCVIAADRPVLGQVRPGAEVRFAATDRATALAALREQRDALAAGAAVVREAAGWDALIDAAGG